MPPITDPNVLVDLSTADDAAIYRITDDIAAVLTVDYFTPIVDDPYEFGRIAVTNALSDVYAMGATPVIGLNLVGYPSKTQPLEVLEAILKGGSDQATAAGVSVVGGHSIDDPEPKYGMAVLGLVSPDQVMTNAGAQVGDLLVLTKPIGTGIISTAIKHNVAPPDVIADAIRVMTTLNASAAEVMTRVGCSACTDVTGFGLLGHLREMTLASGVGAAIRYDAVPVIDGVMDLLELDMAPGGTEANLAFLENSDALVWDGEFGEDRRLLLCDAQTAGGLLISVAPERTDAMMEELRSARVAATVIGEIVTDPDCRIVVNE